MSNVISSIVIIVMASAHANSFYLFRVIFPFVTEASKNSMNVWSWSHPNIFFINPSNLPLLFILGNIPFNNLSVNTYTPLFTSDICF